MLNNIVGNVTFAFNNPLLSFFIVNNIGLISKYKDNKDIKEIQNSISNDKSPKLIKNAEKVLQSEQFIKFCLEKNFPIPIWDILVQLDINQSQIDTISKMMRENLKTQFSHIFSPIQIDNLITKLRKDGLIILKDCKTIKKCIINKIETPIDDRDQLATFRILNSISDKVLEENKLKEKFDKLKECAKTLALTKKEEFEKQNNKNNNVQELLIELIGHGLPLEFLKSEKLIEGIENIKYLDKADYSEENCYLLGINYEDYKQKIKKQEQEKLEREKLEQQFGNIILKLFQKA